MANPARRKSSIVAFSREPLGMPSLSFISIHHVDGLFPSRDRQGAVLRVLGVSFLASVNRIGIVSALVSYGPLAVFQAAEEAALVAFMADAGAERFDFDQDGVAVAIGGDFLHDEAMAGALAFQPELAARAAVESGETGLDGEAEGLFVHVTD